MLCVSICVYCTTHMCAMSVSLMAATYQRLQRKFIETSCSQKSPEPFCPLQGPRIALLAPGGTVSLDSLCSQLCPRSPAVSGNGDAGLPHFCSVPKQRGSQIVCGTHFSHSGHIQSLAWGRGRVPEADALNLFAFSLWILLFERLSKKFPVEKRNLHPRPGWPPKVPWTIFFP